MSPGRRRRRGALVRVGVPVTLVVILLAGSQLRSALWTLVVAVVVVVGVYRILGIFGRGRR